MGGDVIDLKDETYSTDARRYFTLRPSLLGLVRSSICVGEGIDGRILPVSCPSLARLLPVSSNRSSRSWIMSVGHYAYSSSAIEIMA